MFSRKFTLEKLCLMIALVIVWAGPGPYAVAVAADKVKETPSQMLYVTEGTFDEVKENIDLAITGQGLVINSIATVGDMLESTGKDLGATRQVYVHGDVFEFCSATLSREMLEADQFNLVYCPYTIQVFEVPEQPGRIYVGYRRPDVTGSEASRMALQKVEALLDTIVNEALSW